MPVFVALSPTGEPLVIEVLLCGNVIARSEPDAMPPVAALTATDAPRTVTLRLIGSYLPAAAFRHSTVRPKPARRRTLGGEARAPPWQSYNFV